LPGIEKCGRPAHRPDGKQCEQNGPELHRFPFQNGNAISGVRTRDLFSLMRHLNNLPIKVRRRRIVLFDRLLGELVRAVQSGAVRQASPAPASRSPVVRGNASRVRGHSRVEKSSKACRENPIRSHARDVRCAGRGLSFIWKTRACCQQPPPRFAQNCCRSCASTQPAGHRSYLSLINLLLFIN
jgi:hypothetical protein